MEDITKATSLKQLNSNELARLMSEAPEIYKKLAAEYDAAHPASTVAPGSLKSLHRNGLEQDVSKLEGRRFVNGFEVPFSTNRY